MNELKIFAYSGEELRTIQREDGLWWVLRDVCRVLGLTNPTVVASRLDDDERAKFNLGRQGDTTIINEPGLYAVILRSDKPEAKAFKRWVTHDVLPSIRKNSAYGVTSQQLNALAAARRELQEWRTLAEDAEEICATTCRRYDQARKAYDKSRAVRDELRQIVAAKEQNLSDMVAALTTL